MKGNRKTDSAVNDEQDVDFVEDSVELAENGKPILAEIPAGSH